MSRQVLSQWLDRVKERQEGHQLAAGRYSKLHNFLGVPVVVTTAIVGTAAVTSAIEQSTDSLLAIGFLSALAAVLAAVQAFFSFGKLSEKHRVAAARYGLLRRDLEYSLSKDEDPEQQKVEQFQSTLASVEEESPGIPKRIIEKARNALKGKSATSVEYFTERERYYNEYYRQVSNAREDIVMIGDGFAYDNDINLTFANGLVDSMRKALDRGVVIKRFQYHTTLSLGWMNKMSEIKEDYPTLFNFYMDKSLDPKALPYVICLVDKDRPEYASMNVMFTVPTTSILKKNIAGPGFILKAGANIDPKLEKLVQLMDDATTVFFKKECAKSSDEILNIFETEKQERKNKILQYINNLGDAVFGSGSIETVGSEIGVPDLDFVKETAVKYFEEMNELCFAYGSNIEIKRIHRRCPHASFLDIAILKKHRLAFNMVGNAGEGKGGGIANVIPSDRDEVYGVLYAIPKDELASLSKIEEEMHYDTKTMEIVALTPCIGMVKAIVYVGPHNKPIREYKPTDKYREFIEEGMTRRKLPDDYRKRVISQLNKLLCEP